MRFQLTVWVFLLSLNALRAQSLEKGVVIDSVICEQNPQQSYALYLPGNYDPKRSWPAIFIFEPAARGSLPVRHFKTAAEEMGYILIGSNNSRNGSWDIAFNAADAMFADVLTRFNIDTSRVYTSGFSGGSRVATAVAAITGKIRGVLACGAGFSTVDEYQLQENSKVLYVGVVGNQDINYQEHRLLEEKLNERNVANTRIIFNAGHQWPPSTFLHYALSWIELQNFKQKQSISPSFSVKKAYELQMSYADSVLKQGNLVLADYLFREMADEYKDFLDVDSVVGRLERVDADKRFKKQQRKMDRVNKQEMEERELLGEAFTELYFTKLKKGTESGFKDMQWWQNKIDEYKKLVQRDDFQTRNMALRLLNVVWARSAESSFNMMNAKDYETAFVLNKIWLYAEPNNWGKWNMAKILAFQGDLAFTNYLQEILNGTNQLTKKAIRTEEAFQPYVDHDKLKNILSQINSD